MPVVEVVSFTASQELLADPALGDKPLEYITKSEGCLSYYRGFAVEDQKQAYMIIVWETFDHYENMTKREDYPSFLEKLKIGLAGGLSIRHVEVEIDSTNTFSAPVTEVVILGLKEGKTKENLYSVLANIRENLAHAVGSHSPAVGGAVKQTPGTFLLAVGWDSVEAHKSAVQGPPNSELVANLAEVASLDVKHVVLSKAF